MTYQDLRLVVNDAWNKFYAHLVANGINRTADLDDLLDRKDVFNITMDCVIHVAPLEGE